MAESMDVIDALIKFLFDTAKNGCVVETNRYLIYNHFNKQGKIVIKDKQLKNCSEEATENG